MSGRLQATFQFLAGTENEAALQILIAALDYPHRTIRGKALRALLERRSPKGHREVFRRLSSMDEYCREIVNERPERLVDAVGDALCSPRPENCRSACDAIISFRLYGVIAALTSALVDTKAAHAELLADTTLRLTELFYAELSGIDDQPQRRQREALRDRITSCLEDAVRKFHRHHQLAVVEALLLVAKPSNAVIRQILQRSRESSHGPILELLSTSPRGGVIRLLLGFLEEPQMPRVVCKLLSSRCDEKFLPHLLQAVGTKPSKTVARTLARIKSLAWADPGNPLLAKLDGTGQAAAIQLVLASSIDRHEALKVIEHLLLNGKPEGRRAAANALEQFEGPEPAEMVVRALNDEDALVRAALLVQLRPRRIPDAFCLLVGMIGDTEEEVMQALRKAMPEFSLGQFLANLETMADELRPMAGYIVRMIDPNVLAELRPKLENPSHAVRRRAVSAATAMGLVEQLEETMIKLLADEDHTVRAMAAEALADCRSRPTWEALRDALLDPSLVVRRAAQQSLESISQCLLRPAEEEAEQPAEVSL